MNNTDFRIEMPEKVEYILSKLMEHGYEAYAVGGCVRDTILGRVPGDWDITTSALPEEVKSIFLRTIDTGIEHGTVTVMLEKEGFEVTTYRIDGEYEDGRHPKDVFFTSNLVEDLRRRDFTINAMAYNHKDGLVDAFQGMEDMEQKVIRCVGSPDERFDEDALRILRAIRFAGQLGFEIEEATLEAIKKKAPTLEKISQERIRVELNKLLLSNRPHLLITAAKTGITKVVLPEFDSMLSQEQNNPHHRFNVGEHCLEAVLCWNQYRKQHVVDDKLASAVAWTMLLHDCAKPDTFTEDETGIAHFYNHAKKSAKLAKTILRRLKFDNYTIDLASHLIEWHDYRIEPIEKSVRKAASKVGSDFFPILLLVQRMDILAQSEYRQREKLEKLDKVTKLFEKIKEKEQCLSIRELAIDGKILIEECNIPRGPQIGSCLQQLLEYVLENPEENTKEALINYIKK